MTRASLGALVGLLGSVSTLAVRVLTANHGLGPLSTGLPVDVDRSFDRLVAGLARAFGPWTVDVLPA
jgi:hypothetical protein